MITQPIQIVLTALYFGALLGYTTVSAGNKTKKRFLIKLSLVLLYLALAITNYLLSSTSVAYAPLVFATLCCCAIGDMLLAHKGNKFFAVGSIFFMAANILLVINQVIILWGKVAFSDIWWCMIIFVGMLSLFAFGVCKKFVSFGRLLPLLIVYVNIVTLSGVLGVAQFTVGLPNLVCLGVGTLLFMISDYLLGVAKFSSSRPAAVQILNSITYFSAMYFIALSLSGVAL